MQFGTDLTTLLLILGSIIISLSVHETMHAYVGYKLGDDTARDEGRISFNPLNHIDPFMTLVLPVITMLIFGVPILAAKPVPFNPSNVKWDEFGAALIAFAGPISNIVMAVVASLLIGLVGDSGFLTNTLTIFAGLNVGIFVFNMVPIPPLDGSRVLFAFAPEPIQDFMASIERYGLIIIFTLIIAFPPFGTLLVNINTTILNFIL